mmetsp:Transcript_7787/g.14919  ORF Transcript_7787/g.14919 Transcript_7787/m.14919 type:complete len:268 (-) Transcript_7787:1935-2738(-)
MVASNKSCPLCRSKLTPKKLIPLSITYAASPKKSGPEVAEEDDVIIVKEKYSLVQRRAGELEHRRVFLERICGEKDTEIERLRQELRLKEHSLEEQELLINYQTGERDELKKTVERLQAIYARSCQKLKDIEDQNRELKILNTVREQAELGKDTIEWADKIRASVGVSDQALHFYMALKFNNKLLRETEQQLAHANAQLEQLKTQNSKYKRQGLLMLSTQMSTQSQDRVEEVTSLKRPRPADSFLAEGSESLERLAPPKKRPLSLIR